jgi:hypothetical protein
MVATPAQAGVQKCLFFLDSGFRRNDWKGHFLPFYECIKIPTGNLYFFLAMAIATWYKSFQF